MKCHVQIVEVAEPLKVLVDENFDLTSGVGLPNIGDAIWLYVPGRKVSPHRQYRVVDRHWNIGNVIGMVIIYVSRTLEDVRTV